MVLTLPNPLSRSILDLSSLKSRQGGVPFIVKVTQRGEPDHWQMRRMLSFPSEACLRQQKNLSYIPSRLTRTCTALRRYTWSASTNQVWERQDVWVIGIPFPYKAIWPRVVASRRRFVDHSGVVLCHGTWAMEDHTSWSVSNISRATTPSQGWVFRSRDKSCVTIRVLFLEASIWTLKRTVQFTFSHNHKSIDCTFVDDRIALFVSFWWIPIQRDTFQFSIGQSSDCYKGPPTGWRNKLWNFSCGGLPTTPEFPCLQTKNQQQ